MIAVDTNILVYAHREDSEWHARARQTMVTLAEGTHPWGIPWAAVHEFLAIVTHPRIYTPPTPAETALAAVDVWLSAPSCRALGEGPGYFDRLHKIMAAGKVAGPKVHDARIAAVCLENGVTELWTADRDFSRFSALTVRNPLL